MVTTHAFEEEESPERNDAAEDAERELAYLDQQELLIPYDQEQTAQVNAMTMTPTPQATAASWFASKPTDADRPQTRSITQPRRSPRLDRTTGMKNVAFEVPLLAIKRPVAQSLPRRSSPPLRPISPLSVSPSPPESPSVPTLVDPSNLAQTSAAGEADREVQLDKDSVQIPMSFPVQDLGEPTPGTTHLNEPPEGELPPSPSPQSCVDQPPGFENSRRGPLPPALHVHAYNKICSIAKFSEIANISIQELSEVLLTQCEALENPPLVSVSFLHNDKIALQQLIQYRESQTKTSRRYSMATLATGGSELEIDGKRPRTAVIDSGASSIIMGRSFSEQIRRCRSEELIFGDTFVTAGGTTETCLGRTKHGLTFTLAKGTKVQTTITAPVIIANTDAYDVILGTDFLGPLFAYVEPLTEEF